MLLWEWAGKTLKEEAEQNDVSGKGVRAGDKEKTFFEAPIFNSSKKGVINRILLSGFGGQPRLIVIACIILGDPGTPLTNNSREESHFMQFTKN